MLQIESVNVEACFDSAMVLELSMFSSRFARWLLAFVFQPK